MIASERARYIIKSLNENGIVNLKEISKELGISEITTRRDLEKLEKEGKLKRVQGGATIETEQVQDSYKVELTMKERKMLHRAEKEQVARYAALFVSEGDNVFLDAGTSMIPLMRILETKRIRIVTYNDLLIGGIRNSAAEVFVIGGQHSFHYDMNVGSLAQDMLKQFHFDKAFFGCTNVDFISQAVYTTEMESFLMKKIAMENAEKSYLLTDHSKLGKRNFLKIADIKDFECIICDGLGKDSLKESGSKDEESSAFPENMKFA